MMKKELSFEHVSFSYSSGESFIEDLSFSLSSGEFVAVAGGNGSGKSTFMRLASGFLHPCKGKILLRGRELYQYTASQRAAISGFVPQELPAPSGMTVEELVTTGRTAKRNCFTGMFLSSSVKDRQAVKQALEDMDIAHLADRNCLALSGGEYKRASIAAILAQQGEILLLDEPCSSLDYAHMEGLMRTLEKLRKERNISIVMVTHDLILPAGYARRFVLMKKGKIVADGPTEQILQKSILEKVYDCSFEILKDGRGNPVPVVRTTENGGEKEEK